MFTNYDTAAPNTMVVGHLLARLNQRMFNHFPKNIKTFCIGKFFEFVYFVDIFAQFQCILWTLVEPKKF